MLLLRDDTIKGVKDDNIDPIVIRSLSITKFAQDIILETFDPKSNRYEMDNVRNGYSDSQVF